MTRTDDRLLRLEVEELTQLLRHDKRWSAVRDAIAAKNVDIANVLLAGFFEDEQSRAYGVLALLDDDELVEFQMSAHRRLTKWTKTRDVARLLKSFAAVEVAIAMRQAARG